MVKLKKIASFKVNYIDLLRELFGFMSNFKETILGATARDCGNYLDMNLQMARYEAKKFLNKRVFDINIEDPFIISIIIFTIFYFKIWMFLKEFGRK